MISIAASSTSGRERRLGFPPDSVPAHLIQSHEPCDRREHASHGVDHRLNS